MLFLGYTREKTCGLWTPNEGQTLGRKEYCQPFPKFDVYLFITPHVTTETCYRQYPFTEFVTTDRCPNIKETNLLKVTGHVDVWLHAIKESENLMFYLYINVTPLLEIRWFDFRRKINSKFKFIAVTTNLLVYTYAK